MLSVMFFFAGIRFSYAKIPACPFIENKPVKVESWLSKRYEKNYRQLTVQQKKVKAFGLLLDNPKLMKGH